MTREKAFDVLDKLPLCYECSPSNYPYSCQECGDAFLMAMEALKQPEIVRCKDCKYNNPFGCMKLQIIVGDDWFCADGERR